MENFMMPPQAGVPGELPPGMPPQVPIVNGQTQVPGTVPPPQEIPPAIAPPNPREMQAKQGLLQDEGATGPSPTGDGFFDKLRTDPKMSQAMLMMGMRMMQGGKPGQDTMGIVGDAMMAGAAAHNMLKYNEQEGARKDLDQAQRMKEGDARIAASNAQTDQTRQNMDFKAQLQPEEVARAKQLILNLKTQGKLDEARLLGEAVRNDPVLVRKQIGAQIDASRASAASGYASANSSDSLASDRKQELEWKRVVADPKATEERKKAAKEGLQAGLSGSRSGGAASAGVQNRADLYKYYEGITPGASVAELNQKVLDHESTVKRKEVGAELSEFAYKHGFDITKPEGLAEARKTYDRVYGTKPAAASGSDMAAWEKAKNSVAVGQTYTGPDGVNYKRTK